MQAPVYLLFAGVNGVGKSTFYRANHWHEADIPAKLPRVNSDELLVDHGGDPLSSSDQIKAGREALRLIDKHFAQGKSFNQETTLTGHTCLRTIARAQREGYRIILNYIGVESPETALSRIEHRVSLGGHPIDEAAVRRRYRTSLQNLSNVINLCDKVNIYDNTINFTAIARWRNGTLTWVGNLQKHGTWLMDAVRDDSLWRV